MLEKYKYILWDFDGVIMDSMPIRNQGFIEVLRSYPDEQVAQLMNYHLANGGLSRYVKFRYFFENIRGEEVSDIRIQELADAFSKVMREQLINPKMIYQEVIEFIEKNCQKYPMHIVSGSDGNELRYITERMDIAKYFQSIQGSPTPKKELVKNLIIEYNYPFQHCVLIGDSHNDLEAAEANNIAFIGYNNKNLQTSNHDYIESFSTLL